MARQARLCRTEYRSGYISLNGDIYAGCGDIEVRPVGAELATWEPPGFTVAVDPGPERRGGLLRADVSVAGRALLRALGRHHDRVRPGLHRGLCDGEPDGHRGVRDVQLCAGLLGHAGSFGGGG